MTGTGPGMLDCAPGMGLKYAGLQDPASFQQEALGAGGEILGEDVDCELRLRGEERCHTEPRAAQV